MITLKVDDIEVKRLLEALSHRLDDMTPAMKKIADQLEATVRMNFKAQGRPERWKPSKRALRQGGETLRDSGRLRDSIQPDYGRDFAEVGTSVKYAPTHQFGAKKGAFGRKKVRVRAHRRRVETRDMRQGRRASARGVAFVKEHWREMDIPWGDIPARPFMVVPDEDMEVMKNILMDFILS